MNQTIKDLIESISNENAISFKNDLLKHISDIGITSISKNDLIEYILYLSNKYSRTHIVDKTSNFKLAIAFKATETKIKSTKLNIALKYQQNGKDPINEFLHKLVEHQEYIQENGNDFNFVVDDCMLMMCLQSELKEMFGKTLNFKENHEIVCIDKGLFFAYLQRRSNMSEDLFISEYLLKKAKNEDLKNRFKEKAMAAGTKIFDFARDLSKEALSAIIIEMLKKTSGV